MTSIEIKSAMDGHNRQAGRWEKQAKRDGRGSKAWDRWIHHMSEYNRLSEIRDVARAGNAS